MLSFETRFMLKFYCFSADSKIKTGNFSRIKGKNNKETFYESKCPSGNEAV